jgi:hypothetical protein
MVMTKLAERKPCRKRKYAVFSDPANFPAEDGAPKFQFNTSANLGSKRTKFNQPGFGQPSGQGFDADMGG